MTGKELDYISEAHSNGVLAGDGPFTMRCHKWLQDQSKTHRVLLTHSCTAALEMAAILLDINPGDEIIMPSYTFVSTANAFVLRGGIPVFIDIREDTLNLDEQLIESAVTSRTRAIVPVHYAGVACEMDSINQIGLKYNLKVIEDAAQGVMACYKGRPLGGIGSMGAYSFHETKNLISGEGGALLVNDPGLSLRAEIIRDKGTDRSRFFRGEVDKYSWRDRGSSYLPGELVAAFLWAQLEEAASITAKRMNLWNFYHHQLEEFEADGLLRRPIIPIDCQHNAHMYYVLLPAGSDRDQVLSILKRSQIHAIFHYVPLHSSHGGAAYGRIHGDLRVTNLQSESIIRLPLWIGMTHEQQELVINTLRDAILATRIK